jgi:hypothetical protein
MRKLEDLTRVVVVHDGTAKEFFADEWEFSRQDDGQTLKLFATGDGAQPRAARHEALTQDI